MLQPRKPILNKSKKPFQLQNERNLIQQDNTFILKPKVYSNKTIDTADKKNINYVTPILYEPNKKLITSQDYDTYYQSLSRMKKDSLASNDIIQKTNELPLELTKGRLNLSKIDKQIPRDLISAAKRQNIDPILMISLAARENNLDGALKNERSKTLNKNSYINTVLGADTKKNVVSGWNLANDYLPKDINMFFADNKVPGYNIKKTSKGWKAEQDFEKIEETEKYLKNHPELGDKYKNLPIKNIKNLNSYDLAAKFIKEKGLKNYNPGDPKYVSDVMNDYSLLKQDPNMQKFLSEENSKKQNTQFAMGGNLNNNMRRYAQGGDLTQFNEGGLHSQNPLGGVPIGNNNSVEEGETKQNNFIYSNRIFLDSNIVSQYNLPKSLVGKSVADATKMIDDKFKGRNDKISQSTKNGMLSKIAEAQEAMKPQEPEMEQAQESMIDPTQMAFGGFAQYDTLDPNAGIGYKFGSNVNAGTTDVVSSGLKDASSKTGLGLSSALGAASTAIDLGKTAFGKPSQDTSGLAASAPINSAGMIGGSALKGASAGMAFGPLGAGIGAAIGGVAGLLGSGKAKKAAIENTNNYAVNVNKQFSDQYAMGGEIDPPTKGDIWQTKNIVKYQPGVTSGEKGESGFYLYSKDSSDPTFNYKTDREFVRNSSMDIVQKTAQWQDYMRNKSAKGNQFALGGPITGFGADGKWIKPLTSEYSTNAIQNVHDYYGVPSNTKGYGKSIGPITQQFADKKNGFEKGITTELPNILNKKQSQERRSSIYKDMGLTPEGYRFTPETPVFPQKTDPIITPTQTLAGFEAYADAKQAEEAAAAEAIKNKKSIAGKALSYTNDNLGNIARYAPIAANALQLAQLKKPQGERLDRLSNRYRPEYVDEAQLQNIANQTMNNSINAVGQSGASQGQLRSSIIGSQLQRTKAVSDAYNSAASQNRATNDKAQTFNLGVDQVNLQQSNTEKENFARDQAAYRNAKREYITGIGEGIGDIGKEQTYKKIIAKTTGYKWDGEYVKSPDGTVVTDPATGKPMTEEKLKEIQSIKDKKALGGYLIKNKRQ